eukprot:scaffold7751_cov229-Ochromonas_danica.AAC.4
MLDLMMGSPWSWSYFDVMEHHSCLSPSSGASAEFVPLSYYSLERSLVTAFSPSLAHIRSCGLPVRSSAPLLTLSSLSRSLSTSKRLPALAAVIPEPRLAHVSDCIVSVSLPSCLTWHSFLPIRRVGPKGQEEENHWHWPYALPQVPSSQIQEWLQRRLFCQACQEGCCPDLSVVGVCKITAAPVA